MRYTIIISFVISFVSGICYASASDFSCEVAQINDEDAVMYFEMDKGSLISGNFLDKTIEVGSLGYSGKEVEVIARNPTYTVRFEDPDTGNWIFEIDYTSGIGILKDSSGQSQVLANCVWQQGIDPFRQPDIALGN